MVNSRNLSLVCKERLSVLKLSSFIKEKYKDKILVMLCHKTYL